MHLCDICDIQQDENLTIHVNDGIFTIAGCLYCGLPIVIYNKHGADPTKDELEFLRLRISKMWKSGKIVSNPSHDGFHWHRHIAIGG
jgi:hypothetical protein